MARQLVGSGTELDKLINRGPLLPRGSPFGPIITVDGLGQAVGLGQEMDYSQGLPTPMVEGLGQAPTPGLPLSKGEASFIAGLVLAFAAAEFDIPSKNMYLNFLAGGVAGFAGMMGILSLSK